MFPEYLKSETDINSDTTVTTLTSGGYNITTGNTLTINISSGTTTYADVIRGAGNLAKSGNGTLTLTGTIYISLVCQSKSNWWNSKY